MKRWQSSRPPRISWSSQDNLVCSAPSLTGISDVLFFRLPYTKEWKKYCIHQPTNLEIFPCCSKQGACIASCSFTCLGPEDVAKGYVNKQQEDYVLNTNKPVNRAVGAPILPTGTCFKLVKVNWLSFLKGPWKCNFVTIQRTLLCVCKIRPYYFRLTTPLPPLII